MNKRGENQKNILIILILFLVIILASAFLLFKSFYFSETKSGSFLASLKINSSNVRIAENNIILSVNRVNNGSLQKIRFIISNGTFNKIIEKDANLSQFGEQTFILSFDGVSNPISINAIPVNEENGKEVVGRASVYEISNRLKNKNNHENNFFLNGFVNSTANNSNPFVINNSNNSSGNNFYTTNSSIINSSNPIRNNSGGGITDCFVNDKIVSRDAKEICNGIDDNCDGIIDEDSNGNALTQSCYSGDQGTAGVGLCKEGTQVCSNGVWGPCSGQILPSAEICDSNNPPQDENCNGVSNEGCSCIVGQTRICGTSVGMCRSGIQTCWNNGSWGGCVGAINPSIEICDGIDNNCNGIVDENVKNTYYRDSDGDGYGNFSDSIQACSPPSGYVSVGGDCNDHDSNVHPDASGVCVQQPNPQSITCSDNDVYGDINFKGTCVSNGISYVDACDIGGKLWQTYCNATTNLCEASYSLCPAGNICQNGVCVPQPITCSSCGDYKNQQDCSLDSCAFKTCFWDLSINSCRQKVYQMDAAIIKEKNSDVIHLFYEDKEKVSILTSDWLKRINIFHETSSDKGLTWSLKDSSGINYPTGSWGARYDESASVLNNGGILLAYAMASCDKTSDAVKDISFTSQDNGLTWSSPSDIFVFEGNGDCTNSATKATADDHTVATLNDGSVLIMAPYFLNLDYPNRASDSLNYVFTRPKGMISARSYDGGRTWTDKIIYDGSYFSTSVYRSWPDGLIQTAGPSDIVSDPSTSRVYLSGTAELRASPYSSSVDPVLFISNDNGRTWNFNNPELIGQYINSISIPRIFLYQNKLYAVVESDHYPNGINLDLYVRNGVNSWSLVQNLVTNINNCGIIPYWSTSKRCDGIMSAPIVFSDGSVKLFYVRYDQNQEFKYTSVDISSLIR